MRRKFPENVFESQKQFLRVSAAIFYFSNLFPVVFDRYCFYLMYASFRSVMAKNGQNTNPYPDGKFFLDLKWTGNSTRRKTHCWLTLSAVQKFFKLAIAKMVGARSTGNIQRLHQMSKFHHQALFVSKILRIFTLCA